jgi:hypothetical protein
MLWAYLPIALHGLNNPEYTKKDFITKNTHHKITHYRAKTKETKEVKVSENKNHKR